MSPFSQIKPNYPLNSTDFNSQLHLMHLAVGLLQANASQEGLRLKARKAYRDGRGKGNRAGAWGRDPVRISEIQKITTPTAIVNSDQGNEATSTETVIASETSKSSLKRLSKDEVKEYIKSARQNSLFVEGVDFSKMDLSDLDLNHLSFGNCNFSGAKFPSIDGVFFDNSCNLEGSDFSNITIGKVDFGSGNIRKNMDNLILFLGQNHLHMNADIDKNISSVHSIEYFKDFGFKTQDQTVADITALDQATRLKVPILNLKNANFSGTKFNNFWAINADFTNANFKDVKFRVNQGYPENGFNSFDPYLNTGLNLNDAIFEFYNNQNQKIYESAGAKIFKIEVNKDLEELLTCNQIISNKFLEKMQSGQEILVLINADLDEIPYGLKLQNFDSSQSYIEIRDQEKIKKFEAKTVELANKYFERYNIKFVTKEMLGDKTAEKVLNLNMVKTSSLIAGTDLCSFFNLGNNEHNVFISPEIADKDFESVFLHEMMHMFFQHPIQHQSLLYPSKISYLQPMAQISDSNGHFFAQNIIPIITPTIVDQKLLEDYMSALGRKPVINADIELKYDPEKFGIQSSYNPDKNFQNIASFSFENFDEKNEIIIMNGQKALAYCANLDPYNCDSAKGLEDSQAILIMNKETGAVRTMFLLSGENSKIKIDEQIYDLKDFIGENIFSILRKNEQGDIGFDKYQEATCNEAGFFLENKILKGHEDIEREKLDSPKPKIIAKSEDESAKDLLYLIATQLGINLSLIASGVACYKARRGLKATHLSRPANAESTHSV
ncbi:MAG: pentapeptide repeat-containing protein [Rickettsiales bacterium]